MCEEMLGLRVMAKKGLDAYGKPERIKTLNCIVVLFCGLKTRQNLSYYLDLS